MISWDDFQPWLIGEGYNHFELHETLGNSYSLLGRAGRKELSEPWARTTNSSTPSKKQSGNVYSRLGLYGTANCCSSGRWRPSDD